MKIIEVILNDDQSDEEEEDDILMKKKQYETCKNDLYTRKDKEIAQQMTK